MIHVYRIDSRCVMCGAEVPEGMMVCPICVKRVETHPQCTVLSAQPRPPRSRLSSQHHAIHMRFFFRRKPHSRRLK